MLVKDELKKLGLNYVIVDLGMVEILENITMEQRVQLKENLMKSGLELLDDKKSILIENIKNLGRAFGLAISATGTTFRINIPGFFFDGSGEITLLPGDTGHLGQGMHFYIGMSTGFNHAGGNHTHGTVTGGKGFVQSGHSPAD